VGEGFESHSSWFWTKEDSYIAFGWLVVSLLPDWDGFRKSKVLDHVSKISADVSNCRKKTAFQLTRPTLFYILFSFPANIITCYSCHYNRSNSRYCGSFFCRFFCCPSPTSYYYCCCSSYSIFSSKCNFYSSSSFALYSHCWWI